MKATARTAIWLLNILGTLADNSAAEKACSKPRVRQEWRTLDSSQRYEYLRAVICLWTSPAKGYETYPVRSRHDDFAANHINATGPAILSDTGDFAGFFGPGIHRVGLFLPWHRYFLWQYETALIEECGYNGAQPYWDWSLDVTENNNAKFAASPIFDPVFGFGGNGVDGSVPVVGNAGIVGTPLGSCVVDGPFAMFPPVLNPGPPPLPSPPGILLANEWRCLHRNFQIDNVNVGLGWKGNVEPLLAVEDYANFTYWFDADVGKTGNLAGIHGSGHAGVGGEMENAWSSANDPLFFMHHANLDRIWRLWQNKKPSNLYAAGGPIWPNGTGEVTLETTLWFDKFIGPSLPIKTVQDPLNTNGEGFLCYDYAESPLAAEYDQSGTGSGGAGK